MKLNFLATATMLSMYLMSMANAVAAPPSHAIGRFSQEIPIKLTSVPIASGTPANETITLSDVQSIYLDSSGLLNVLCANAHYTLHIGSLDPKSFLVGQPIANIAKAWSTIQTEAIPQANQVLPIEDGRFLLATNNGLLEWENGKFTPRSFEGIKVNSLARADDGRLAAGTEAGLFETSRDEFQNGGQWKQIDVLDAGGRAWAARDVRIVVYDAQQQLWFGQLAGLGCRSVDGWKFYEGRDGLPYSDFTAAAAGPDGRLWFGTTIGVVGFDNGRWLYRQGKRFLPGDEVRSIVVAADGTPWIATDGGLSGLASSQMTLDEKANYYEQQIDAYIKRTPFGYTSEVHLKAPNDLSVIGYSDSDNDGLWTAMYGAAQCYAAAVTGSDEHKAAAQKAFEAIRFLQKVTQGGSHSPPLGYIARTILPTDGPNPNDGRFESDKQFKANRDKFWKVYQPRWPTSADGKWFWKSDTSSDELDGHYYFLPLYYDLVADTDEERERVREVVRDLTDHLLAHNFQLVDVDGQPTRWAVFNPENLNQNPRWWVGRGLNSLSILAYLTVAHHVTGDSKYNDAVQLLREKHSYEANAMVAKVQYGEGSGNQSDDEMALMNFYSLIKYAPDEQLRQTMTYSMFTYWRLVQPDRNPFFHFCYAVHGLGKSHQTAFNTFSLAPWDGWLEDSVRTLVDFPLDRLNWAHRNSHRLDLVYLPKAAHDDPGDEGDTRSRGHLVDGKVLPVENRHFNHWNTDSWRLDYGGDGRQLANGTVFLLPYWMGRYHGFIEQK